MAKPVDLVIRVKADTGEVAPGMARLDNELDSATKAAKKLDAELTDVSRHDVDIDVNTQAITAARRRIDDLRDDIARTKAMDIDADTRPAEQEIAKLRRSIKALSDDAKAVDLTPGGSAGGGFGRVAQDADTSFGHASERVTEFKDEARQNFGEVTSSFQGSMDSIGDLVQGTLGGLAGTLAGPVGLALGAASVGVGLLVAGMTQSAEAANQAKQDVVDLAAAIREAGGDVSDLDWSEKFQTFADTVVDTKSWFEPWQKSSVTALEKAAATAEKTGVSFEDLFQGMAGDVPAATRAIDTLNKRIADQQEVVDNLTPAMEGYNSAHAHANDKQREALGTLKGYREELEKSIGTTDDAVKRNELFADAMGMTVEQYQANQEAAEAAKEAQDAFTASLADTADPVSTYEGLLAAKTEAEKAAAQATADATEDGKDSWEDYAGSVTVTTQDLIDEWNRQAEAAKAFETNLGIIAAAGGQALADELRAKGPEVAGAVAAVIAQADPATQQAAIDAHAGATGTAMADSVADNVNSPKSKAKVYTAFKDLIASISGTTTDVPFYLRPVPGGPGGAPQSAAPQSVAPAAGGNVRVYIDGNQLRATVRTDVSAASARAALVGTTGRSRP